MRPDLDEALIAPAPDTDTFGMSTLRGFLASLGAGASLVAAAACSLLVVSTVVALEGWPGLDRAAQGPTLVLGDLSAPRSDSDGASAATRSEEPVVLPAAGGSPARSSGAGGGGGGERRAGGGRDAPPRGGDAPAPTPVVSAGPGPTTTTVAPPIAPRETEPVRGVVQDTTDIVRETGGHAGTTTDGLLPGTGGLVENTTGTVGDTVDGVAGTLADTVDALLPGR